MNGVHGTTFHNTNQPVAIPVSTGLLNINPKINPTMTGLDMTKNTNINIFQLRGSVNLFLIHPIARLIFFIIYISVDPFI